MNQIEITKGLRLRRTAQIILNDIYELSYNNLDGCWITNRTWLREADMKHLTERALQYNLTTLVSKGLVERRYMIIEGLKRRFLSLTEAGKLHVSSESVKKRENRKPYTCKNYTLLEPAEQENISPDVAPESAKLSSSPRHNFTPISSYYLFKNLNISQANRELETEHGEELYTELFLPLKFPGLDSANELEGVTIEESEQGEKENPVLESPKSVVESNRETESQFQEPIAPVPVKREPEQRTDYQKLARLIRPYIAEKEQGPVVSAYHFDVEGVYHFNESVEELYLERLIQALGAENIKLTCDKTSSQKVLEKFKAGLVA